MLDKERKIKLSDLVDVKLLQKFQDAFAKTMNVASLTYDDQGPITKPSNFNEFCTKYIKGSELGFKRCDECDAAWGKIAAEKGEPVIYTCHVGLTDFAVPIIVEGKHIGSILGGQVLSELPNEEHSREMARQLGVNEEEYIQALKKINIVPTETVKAAANLLSTVANTIAEIGYKNLELIKKNERETFYKTIVETIRSSLDINETKQKIMDIIGKTLNADRCLIMEYDKIKNEFLPVRDEYLSSEKIIDYKGVNINEELPELTAAIKRGETIIVKDKEIAIDTDGQNFHVEKETFNRYEINSIYAIPLYYFGDLLGMLSLHYVDKGKNISDDEIVMLKMIADQIAIAIYQANLYNTTQLHLIRETLLGEIIEKTRSTLDINQIKNTIVNEMGKLLSADIFVIRYFDAVNDEFLPVDKYSEYKSSPEIKGIREIDAEIGNKPEGISNEYIKKCFKENKEIFIPNVEAEYNELDEPLKLLTTIYGAKSLYTIPIYHTDQFLGAFSIIYTKNVVKLDDENIKLIKTLTAQVGAALHQASLYKMTQIQAEREKISRNIVEILRSTLDRNTIKHLFVKIIGKYFNADRVFLSDYDSKNKRYLPIDKNSEYLSSPEEKSFVDFDFSDDSIRGFIQPLLEKRELKLLSWDEYIKGKPKTDALVSRFENANVKSSYNLPVIYEHKIMGYFCIEYTHEIYKLSDEDINRIRNMCAQAGIALYHSHLYEEAQKSIHAHAEFVNKLSIELKDPLNMIAEFSEQLSLTELERNEEIERLNIINNNAKKLLYLLDDIIKNSKTEIDFN